ncbi:MAG: hypothetical protein R2761_27960 [Acidimicrobiales bacterium]
MTGPPGQRRRTVAGTDATVVYLGRRFVGPLLAERFREGLARAGSNSVRLETSPVRFAGRMVARRLGRGPGGPVFSVMVHPALAVLWFLVPRRERYYVIHDTTPHPGRWWDVRWRLISRLDRTLATSSATVVALSSWSADDWHRRHAPDGQHVALVPLPEVAPARGRRSLRPPELVGLHEPYVLLFGRADTYKGVRELWPDLERWRSGSGYPVVLAGVGAGAEVPPGTADDPGVRVIDRYLDEAEIDWLAGGDCVLLLPYTSATQSGVLERFASGPAVPLGFAVGGLAEQLTSLHPDCAVTPGRHDELLRRLDVLMVDTALRAELAAAKAERAATLESRFVDALSSILGCAVSDPIDLTRGEPETDSAGGPEPAATASA